MKKSSALMVEEGRLRTLKTKPLAKKEILSPNQKNRGRWMLCEKPDFYFNYMDWGQGAHAYEQRCPEETRVMIDPLKL